MQLRAGFSVVSLQIEGGAHGEAVEVGHDDGTVHLSLEPLEPGFVPTIRWGLEMMN